MGMEIPLWARGLCIFGGEGGVSFTGQMGGVAWHERWVRETSVS